MTFEECLSKIKTAVYGKDVRTAIHDALDYLKNNMSGTYTLPAATADTLGGVKLSDDVMLDDNNKLIFKHENVKTEIWNISETSNKELYEALNHLGTCAHVLTSTIKKNSKSLILQICVSADGYPLPVYRIHNGTSWSAYMKFTGYGLSNEFSIDDNGDLVHSMAYKLWLMQFIILTMVESDYISIEDISDEFITEKSTQVVKTDAEIYKSGYVTSGTIELRVSAVQYSATLFVVPEEYRPINSKGVVCPCQTFSGDLIRNDANVTFNPDGTVSFFASDNAEIIDKIVFSFSYHSINGIVSESEANE